MKTIIIGCESDHVSIRSRDVKTGKVSTRKAKDADGIKSAFRKLGIDEDRDVVMFSSSMDFPKEYTSDKKILGLVYKLQGLQ